MMRSYSSRTATSRDRIASQTVEECYFNRKHGEELSTLREGELIRVRGKLSDRPLLEGLADLREGELIRVRGKGAGKIRNTNIVRNFKLAALQP